MVEMDAQCYTNRIFGFDWVVGMPLYNALFLSNLRTFPKTRFIDLHFCCRQGGFNFNRCDVIGPQMFRIR